MRRIDDRRKHTPQRDSPNACLKPGCASGSGPRGNGLPARAPPYASRPDTLCGYTDCPEPSHRVHWVVHALRTVLRAPSPDGGRPPSRQRSAEHGYDGAASADQDCRSQAVSRIEPCLPRPAAKPPAGRDWIHEIKHDGFRIMARRDAAGVRLFTRNGHDFAKRFPMAAAAVAALSARSCRVDGEAIVTDQKGLAVFGLIRGRQSSGAAVLYAFDLLELDGEDLRREPIETRKSTLKSLLRDKHAGIAFNAHFIADGAIVYRQACALGCEGIVSKRLGSPYRSGRADCWIKVKNPAAPAVTREAEEEWS